MLNIQLVGYELLDKRLGIMQDYGYQLVHNALWRGAQLIADTTKSRFMDGPHPDYIITRTGRLKSSIRPIQTSDGAAVISDCIYARVHEFGYPPRNIPARPYLSRGFYAELEHIHKLLGRALRAIVLAGPQ